MPFLNVSVLRIYYILCFLLESITILRRKILSYVNHTYISTFGGGNLFYFIFMKNDNPISFI